VLWINLGIDALMVKNVEHALETRSLPNKLSKTIGIDR
jgi:hypothetical protein